MHTDAIHYQIEIGSGRFVCERVRGLEGMSQTFKIEVDFRLEEGSFLEAAETVRSTATLVLARTGDERRITAIVSNIAVQATKRGMLEVNVILEPSLAILRHRQDIRLFRDKTAPEIVTEVLGEHGVSVDNRLQGSYERRPYCVQFRESDYDFAARLLEDEGIYYFIDNDMTVVLGDAPSAYDSGPALAFIPKAGVDRQQDAVHELGWGGEVTPGKISLRDFNPETPSLDMDVSAAGPWGNGPEWYDYPGEYMVPADGVRKAQLRADALACRYALVEGKSSHSGHRPGQKMVLSNAPPGVTDGEYVLMTLEHAWDREQAEKDQGDFELGFGAIPGGQIFRPMQETHIPTIRNPMTGFVTGPAGEDDVYVNQWGQVKVHFHWDRLFPRDETCSHWVPVLQDNTGSSVAHSRIGWEVMLHFLEGDPDRPVVIGRVYNAEDEFPELLPARKTRTALRSLTTPPHSDGYVGINQILIEDAVGKEQVVIEAERDQNIVIANNKTEQIDHNETHQIKGNESITIGANQEIKVSDNITGRVDGNQTWTVAGNRDIGVKESQTETIEGNYDLTIGGSHKRQMGMSDAATVEKNLSEKVGAVILEGSLASNIASAERLSALTVGGAIIEIAKDNKSEVTSRARAETIGGLVFTKAGDNIMTRVEQFRRTTIGGLMKVTAVKEIILAGLEKLQTQSMIGTYKADKVTLKVGNSEFKLESGVVSLKATDSIKIETKAANNQGAGSSSQI